MNSRLSVRARITIGSLLVAALLLGVALFVAQRQVDAILTDADVALAEGDLTSFVKDITANPNEPVDDPGTGVLVFVRSPEGVVQVNALPHDVLERVDKRAGANEEFRLEDDEGRRFVVVGQTVATPGGDWSLWSARSTNASEIALDGLNRVLIVGGVILLMGFGAASWILATAALRPVARMRKKAEELGDDPGDGDLPVGRTNDEVSELATTLNTFLGKLRSSTLREKQMVSDAAHELRTPLAALKTQLELAHDDFGDAEALATQVRLAEVSVNRLSALATNLLELSRLEAHDGPTASASSDELVTELMGCIDRARMLALASSVEVAFNLVDLGHDQRYDLDGQSFARMTDNLLSNAITALGKGGTVTATLLEDHQGLVLEVADDGPGVPDSFVNQAFKRFSRPDEARATYNGGSGLGLALVKAIAESAGGEASLRNTHPGLAVAITLPKM